MTREEWMNYKDFDLLSREMNGDFSFGQMKMRAAEGSYLLPKQQKSAESIDKKPQAQ